MFMNTHEFQSCRVKKRVRRGPKVIISKIPSQHRPTAARDPNSFLHSNRELPTTTTFTEEEPHAYTTIKDDSRDDTDEFGYLYTSALQVSQHITSRHYPPIPRTEEVREMGESLEDTEQYEVMLATATNPAYKNVPRTTTTTTTTPGIYDQVS